MSRLITSEEVRVARDETVQTDPESKRLDAARAEFRAAWQAKADRQALVLWRLKRTGEVLAGIRGVLLIGGFVGAITMPGLSNVSALASTAEVLRLLFGMGFMAWCLLWVLGKLCRGWAVGIARRGIDHL